MISTCGRDENGKFVGGTAGDQTGKEWYLWNWYSFPWDMVFRHPDPQVREYIALLSEEAANNDKIGYDQGQRLTFWEQLKVSNYRPKNITTPCETDCSGGVCAITKAVGYLLNNQKLKDLLETGWSQTMPSQFKEAGFETLTDSKYLDSDKYLLRGDVLLNVKSHAAINISNGEKVKTTTINNVEEFKPSGTTTNTTVTTPKVESTPSTSNTTTPVFNNNTSTEIPITKIQDALLFNKKYNKGVKFKTTVDLYLRYGASPTKYGAIKVMKKGTECIWFGYYNIDLDTNKTWYYVACGNYIGYCSAKYLKKI